MENAKRARIGYIDIAKGLGMLTVIYGHILYTGNIYTYIYSFHMPLFFFLAGMCYRKGKYSSALQVVKARAKTLLLPYVIFSVGTWGIWALYNLILQNEVESYLSPLLQTFLAQGSGGYLVHNVPLWFIPCLFIVELLYYFIAKLPKKFGLLVCIALATVGHFMSQGVFGLPFAALPLSLDVAMTGVAFYGTGNLLSDFLKKLPSAPSKRKIGLGWAVALLGNLAVYFIAPLNGIVSISGNILGWNTLLFYCVAFLGTASFLALSFVLDKAPLSRLKKGLTYLGRNSFYFMAVHVPIKGFLMAILSKLFGTTSAAMSVDYFYATLTFVLTLIVSAFTVMAINAFLRFYKERRPQRKEDAA